MAWPRGQENSQYIHNRTILISDPVREKVLSQDNISCCFSKDISFDLMLVSATCQILCRTIEL